MTSSMAARPGQPPADITSLTINTPPMASPVPAVNPSGGRDREAQLLKRIRDLEEEVRAVRIENEKQVCKLLHFTYT